MSPKPKKAAATRRRRRGGVATREAIFAAARMHFIRNGYEHVKLRDIARDAEIDVALVCRHFGTKKDLFAEVLRDIISATPLKLEDKSQFGTYIANAFFTSGPPHSSVEAAYLFVRAAASPVTALQLEKVLDEKFIHPFAEWLGGERAILRAHLILNILFGIIVNLLTDRRTRADAAFNEAYGREIAQLLQTYVDGHWLSEHGPKGHRSDIKPRR